MSTHFPSNLSYFPSTFLKKMLCRLKIKISTFFQTGVECKHPELCKTFLLQLLYLATRPELGRSIFSIISTPNPFLQTMLKAWDYRTLYSNRLHIHLAASRSFSAYCKNNMSMNPQQRQPRTTLIVMPYTVLTCCSFKLKTKLWIDLQIISESRINWLYQCSSI